MNTKIFTWKPSDWGENHGSFTNFKIYFARFNPGWGNNPLQFALLACCWKENKDYVYTTTSWHQPEGALTPASLQCRP